MQSKLYKKDGTFIKDFQIYNELNLFQDTETRVCDDLSGNIGDVVVVTNNAGVEYTGEIIGYNNSNSGNYITLKHIIYDLDNHLMTNSEYINTDIGVIFTAILEDYVFNISYPWIDGLSDVTVGQNISITFEDKTYLEAISLLQNYLTDYKISFTLGGNPIEIGLVGNDTATIIDKTRLINTGNIGNYDNVINYVVVKNGDGLREVIQDSASISKIGPKIKKYIRPSIKTTSDAVAFGESILERYSNPNKNVDWIEVNQSNINLYNKKISIEGVDKYIIGGKLSDDTVRYNIGTQWDNSELISIEQDVLEQSIIAAQNKIEQNNDLVGLRGWTTNINFNSQDYNTVTWSEGDINMPNGDVYNIISGNTGNMSLITYVYLDTDISTTTLQTTTISSQSVGNNKLLVCVAKPNSETNKDAVFQSFGNGDQSSFITASNIAANSITANEIQANSLTVNEIDTSSINITEWQNAGTLATADDLDGVPDGPDYGKVLNTSISAGKIVLSETTGNLDDIDDGTTHGKVLNTYLDAGRIKLLSSSDTATKKINIDADVPEVLLDNGTGDKIRMEVDGLYPEIEFDLDNNRVGAIRPFTATQDGIIIQGAALVRGSTATDGSAIGGDLLLDGSLLSQQYLFCGTKEGIAPSGTGHSARLFFGTGFSGSSARYIISDGTDLKRYNGSTYTSLLGGGTSSWVGTATSNLDMDGYNINNIWNATILSDLDVGFDLNVGDDLRVGDNAYLTDIYGNNVTSIDVYDDFDMNSNEITDIGGIDFSSSLFTTDTNATAAGKLQISIGGTTYNLLVLN